MTRPLSPNTSGPNWRRDADVVVVGSGAAGISAALTAAAAGASVLVITKDLTGGASPLAQGGLAAAIGPGDTPSAHAADTETAGVGLCEPDVVAALAAGSPEAVDWLVSRGAQLERRELRLEGGHGRNRIVHSGNDATGAEVHRALLSSLLHSSALRNSRIQVLDRVIALDLAVAPRGDDPPYPPTARPIASDRIGHASARAEVGVPGKRAVGGLMAATIGPGGRLDPGLISARAVILAAGGLGQAFATTSNPAGATGDAMAIAARAGAVLRDPEFVQFHPTVLWLEHETGQHPLITEALRGAGAVLRDAGGKPVMAGHDPRGDLAPRDIVAARIHEVITASGGQHVWLDATRLGADTLENGFPTVTAACRKWGIDPVTDMIPVAPGAHYSCGGVLAGLDGQTSIRGLYAVGEAASTGVHGANRLASNSLVEAVIAGRLSGNTASHEISRDERLYLHAEAPTAGAGVPPASRPALVTARPILADAMSRYAGVLRDSEGLQRLGGIIEEAGQRESPGIVNDSDLDLAAVEATNLRLVSALIAAAALRRTESRGCHRRGDAPATNARARHTLARCDGEQIHVTWENA
jgi:L-aspartate oxidase